MIRKHIRPGEEVEEIVGEIDVLVAHGPHPGYRKKQALLIQDDDDELDDENDDTDEIDGSDENDEHDVEVDEDPADNEISAAFERWGVDPDEYFGESA